MRRGRLPRGVPVSGVPGSVAAAAARRSEVRVGVAGVSPFSATLTPRARFGAGSSGGVAVEAAGRPRPRGAGAVDVGVIPASGAEAARGRID